MSHGASRAAVVDAARSMHARGLGQGTAGNLSARVPEGMVITPSAVPYEALRPEDVVLMDLDGRILESTGLAPSTEWRLHAQLLSARPELDAVLHAHPMFCTTLACLRRDIPPFHYMVAVAGGDSIRCAPYATFGTPELAGHAVTALEDRRACLLANHGMVAMAGSPAAALALAMEVETLAAQYWRTLQVGEPTLLSADEMAEALARFATYGR
jgi:L-fuculose-phosphate aldolase